MLPHIMRQGTDDHPNKVLQQRCATMSGEGALAARLFTGFSHADLVNTGLSAVVVTDDDREFAEILRDELLDRVWVEREAFVYQIEPLANSVARAKAIPTKTPGDGAIVLFIGAPVWAMRRKPSSTVPGSASVPRITGNSISENSAGRSTRSTRPTAEHHCRNPGGAVRVPAKG
jgi:metallopeptidase family M81